LNQKKYRHIICAVRAGPESRATVTRAIDLSLENEARLTFLHVMDAEFLQYATVGPLSIIYRELVEMGKFSMLILCDRAQRRGVSQVDYIIREGNIRKQLLRFAIETKADLLVVGSPTRSPGNNVFRPNELQNFVSELAQAGEIQVIQVASLA